MMASARGGGEPPAEEEPLPPKPDGQGLYDPTISPEELQEAEARKNRSRTAMADGGTACLAGILFALIASTGAFALAAAPPSRRNPRTIWVKGRPVLGFVSGLFAGLGTTVALQQSGVYSLTLTSAVVAPLLTAVMGGWRGWRGSAWTVG
jgi:hypothetical protein